MTSLWPIAIAIIFLGFFAFATIKTNDQNETSLKCQESRNRAILELDNETQQKLLDDFRFCTSNAWFPNTCADKVYGFLGVC